jgi:hypothetical protein
LEVTDLAGKGASNVKAEKPAGARKSNLQNGVPEPLRGGALIE